MEKINFINNEQPALNATNLNKLQQNVENDIGDLSELETSDKDNLVEAINEAKRSGGDAVPIHSIFDYDGDTVPTGYEEVNSYSTNEVKTGDTWIDGKPIYRKVYSGNIANGATLFTNVDAIINISGYGFLGNTSRKVILNGIAADIPTTLFSCFYGLNNTIEFYAKYGGNATTAYNSNIILEYTKTTD